MATWTDLFDAEILPLPKQVCLFVGELSSLVWDKVNEAASKYNTRQRIESIQDIASSRFGDNDDTAYIAVNPSDELLHILANQLSSGMVESLFILMDEAPKDNADFEVVKKKAQHSKHYYVITAPKAETAQAKMVSFFLLRWAVTRDSCFKVCAMLDFSPGKLYLFDLAMRVSTDGKVLASSKTAVIIDELLGSDTPNLVVNNILSGKPFDQEYSREFNDKVIRFMDNLFYNARIIHNAISAGHQTAAAVGKATGLSQFAVHQSWGVAKAYNSAQLRYCVELLEYAKMNVENPEVLSTISKVW